MRVSLASAAAGAAILVLLGAGFAHSVRNAALYRTARAVDAETSRLGASLSAEAHQIDMAGRKAAAIMRLRDDFDAARAALASGGGDWFAVEGVASFEARGGAPKLRRAAPVHPEEAAPPPDLAEHAVALRADALRAAEIAGPRLGLGGPEAVMAATAPDPGARYSSGEASRFWLFWSGGGERAFGALLRLREETRRAALAEPEIAALDLEIRPEEAIAPESRRVVARLGDHVASLALKPATLQPQRRDFATAIDVFGPALACALLLGGLFWSYARRSEQRAAADNKRCAEMLVGVEAKQRQLDRSEERFRHLAESTNVIPWTADLEHQRFTYIGPQIEALSGFSAADWRASGFWAQHIHPQDRQRVLTQALAESAGGRYATVNYRIRGANGKVLHVRNMLSASEQTDEETGRTRLVAHGFLLDVTELRRAAAALEVARRKAEEANRIKSEFLANMSHELRTPLNAVIGFSEIMKDQLFGPLDERYREYAESVHASGQHLLSLINDVLDLSKIEAGRVELTEERADVAEMLRDCRTLLQERIASAGLHAQLVAAHDLPDLQIDERRMKQVILNLISNAIKFTPPGGEIEIGAERLPGRGVRIWVRDTGKGMSEDEIPKALAKFGQVDGDLDRKHQGTGLGLPIAKSLVEMHGGSFEIRSRPGGGTLVSLRLPEERVLKSASPQARSAGGFADLVAES